MNAVAITATVCAAYALYGYVFIRAHDAERLTPRWLRRLGSWLRRIAGAVRARIARAVAAARMRRALISFSLHLLLAPKGVVR